MVECFPELKLALAMPPHSGGTPVARVGLSTCLNGVTLVQFFGDTVDAHGEGAWNAEGRMQNDEEIGLRVSPIARLVADLPQGQAALGQGEKSGDRQRDGEHGEGEQGEPGGVAFGHVSHF